MNYFISLIIGVITSVMILLNGTLSDTYGNYTSTVLIHVVGLVSVIIVLIISKTTIKVSRSIPIYFYSAGFIGVATVIFTNLGFMNLGVSLTQALGLLGQTVLSIILDHFGLMGIKPSRFKVKKLVGLCFIAGGILVMTIY
ncbi:EamA-like transporter family protein [Anaerocolumna sedimenticola]|uniref:EamA-like transporter family protein n=1 Tax=Anaerocolumna sedimenticola TaxID=2696063 RepID=A0A6P1TPC2_9FIRM|nr:DMT family transporter [Anaerocolumna sedimenticola]QHQ63110.1 EamA-like transporter family protein [Anaerocolumna sedimenticola]